MCLSVSVRGNEIPVVWQPEALLALFCLNQLGCRNESCWYCVLQCQWFVSGTWYFLSHCSCLCVCSDGNCEMESLRCHLVCQIFCLSLAVSLRRLCKPSIFPVSLPLSYHFLMPRSSVMYTFSLFVEQTKAFNIMFTDAEICVFDISSHQI